MKIELEITINMGYYLMLSNMEKVLKKYNQSGHVTKKTMQELTKVVHAQRDL